jgi:glycosyltransferase involved in cell wall biosynthesis
MPAVAREESPWLSIVIPTHDGERWLHDTLGSVAAQNETGLDCIVIDSSPGEGTCDIVRSYADRLALRVFRRPDLAHWRSKTNFGFAVAEAPFVAMLHQDDFWLPGRTAKLRAWIAAAPDADMHLHPSRVIDEAGRRVGVWRCPLPGDGQAVPRPLLLERLLVQNFISVPAPVIRRDTYLAAGGIDEALWYTGDWDLYLKIAQRGTVVYHRDVLSCFRIHRHSLTVTGSRSAADFETQMRDVLARHIDAVPPARREAVVRRALASIRVNTSLAAANHGSVVDLLRAAAAIAGLGPRGIGAYLHASRLFERVLPRLRLRLRGGL